VESITKPIDTTHAVLEAAAELLEVHEAARLAFHIRAYAERNIPDVPLYEEMNALRTGQAYARSTIPMGETNAAPETDQEPSLATNLPPVAAPLERGRNSYEKKFNEACDRDDKSTLRAMVAERENRELREALTAFLDGIEPVLDAVDHVFGLKARATLAAKEISARALLKADKGKE
jgi:hypothetical protein